MSTENVASSNPEVGIRSRSFSLLDLLVLVTLFGLIFHAYSISWIPSFEFVMAWIFTAVGGGIVFLRPKVSTTLVLFAFAVVGMGMFPNLAVGALPVLLISIVAICSSSFVRSPRFFSEPWRFVCCAESIGPASIRRTVCVDFGKPVRSFQ